MFWVVLAANLIMMALFTWPAFYAAGIPVALGAPAILLLALALLAFSGSTLVYAANHYALPILTMLALWAALCSVDNDNHMVRVTAESRSHGFMTREKTPDAQLLKAEQLNGLTLASYFQEWWTELQLSYPGDGSIPVFIVAAEGGGLRAAYWTAVVLAELEDRTRGTGMPFSRHVFAISGVSGGSVGATLFDASLAARLRQTSSLSHREELERVLGGDFLSDTFGYALFPDLLQRLLPIPVVSDRAIALERSFERAWSAQHRGQALQLTSAFHELWATEPHRVPLLFLNSTVVETGQRAINYPLASAFPQGDASFADTLPVGSVVGSAMPLSTAALLSARFTYVSPAGLIDTRDTAGPRWKRLVDGGYFDNSGATTAQELARVLLESGGPRLRLIVLHLPNAPEPPSARLNAKHKTYSRLEFLSEVFAPVQTLLNTRGARGTQAVSYLGREQAIELLRIQPQRNPVNAPLGWVLSGQVRHDLSAQLVGCGSSAAAGCAHEEIDKLVSLLHSR